MLKHSQQYCIAVRLYLHRFTKLCMMYNSLTGCSFSKTSSILLSSLVYKCSHYKVVIMRDRNTTNTKTDIPDNTLLPNSQSQTSYYVAAAIRVEDFQSMFLIGDGQTYMLDSERFVNVPLSIDQEYAVFIRLYSSLNVSYHTQLHVTATIWCDFLLYTYLHCSTLFLKTASLRHLVSIDYSITISDIMIYSEDWLVALFHFQQPLLQPHFLLSTLELLLLR